MKRYIAVDSGKNATKVAVYDEQAEKISVRKFRTKIGKGTFDDDDPGKNTFLMEYDGEVYKIGRGADADAELVTSKKTPTHKICTLYAIASVCSEDEIDEVSVTIGIPVKDYENVALRNEYRDYILPEGDITVTCKNSGDDAPVTKTFRIVYRCVRPETLGALFITDTVNTGTIAVIDIGHLNVNMTVYNNLDVDKEYSMTDTLGGNALVTGLSQKLSSNYTFINEKATADILMKSGEDRCLKPNRRNEQIEKDSRQMIDEYLLQHVNKILSHCKSAQWSVDYMSFIFIGGTSALLRKEIREIFGEEVTITERPEYANVIGFLRIMCGKLLGKEIKAD